FPRPRTRPTRLGLHDLPARRLPASRLAALLGPVPGSWARPPRLPCDEPGSPCRQRLGPLRPVDRARGPGPARPDGRGPPPARPLRRPGDGPLRRPPASGRGGRLGLLSALPPLRPLLAALGLGLPENHRGRARTAPG